MVRALAAGFRIPYPDRGHAGAAVPAAVLIGGGGSARRRRRQRKHNDVNMYKEEAQSWTRFADKDEIQNVGSGRSAWGSGSGLVPSSGAQGRVAELGEQRGGLKRGWWVDDRDSEGGMCALRSPHPSSSAGEGGFGPASFGALAQRPLRGATPRFGHVGCRLGCETGAGLAPALPSSLVSGSCAHHQHYQVSCPYY